jgi:hypothetical protein
MRLMWLIREDACRIRDGYSPQNMNLIRKTASTVARSDKGSKTKAEFKRWDGLMIIWRVYFLALTSSKITPIFSLHSALAPDICSRLLLWRFILVLYIVFYWKLFRWIQVIDIHGAAKSVRHYYDGHP